MALNLISKVFSTASGENAELPGLAAVYQLKDLDSFIAKTAVPPPPTDSASSSSAVHRTVATSSIHEDQDLSAFIIPPPPAAMKSTSPGGLPTPKTTIQQQQQQGNSKEKVSPLIASIQQKLMSPTAENKGFVPQRQKEMVATAKKKDASPPPPPPRTTFPPPTKPDKSPLATYQFGSEPAAENGATASTNMRVSMKLPLKSGSPPNSPYKLSVTSSSDSISSSASVNTVKSVSPVDDETDSDGPPSLPPRLSPIKSAPPPPPELDRTVKSKSIVEVGSPKPALPARASKPSPAPATNGNSSRNLPSAPGGSRPSPAKKTVVKIKENGEHHCTTPPPPELPQKTLVAGRKLPLPPPPPPPVKANGHAGPQLGVSGAPLRINQPNGGPKMNGLTNGHHQNGGGGEPELYSNSEFDPDEDSSLEGTSVDDEEQTTGDQVAVFRQAEQVIERVVEHIADSQEICKKNEVKRRYV